MDTTDGSISLGEQILVERSQDSVQVTKNRMQRQHLTARDSSLQEEAQTEGKQRKQAKTRFAEEAQKLDQADKKAQKSLSRRISDALGFRKLTVQGRGPAVEQSSVSLHVQFEQKPKVIE